MAYTQLPIFTLLFLTLTSLTLSELCHPNDKKALLQIQKDLHNPTPLISWAPETDCCTWDVVRCDQETNRITVFDLYATNLHRPIPAAITDLLHLRRLSFHNTNVTGEVPRGLPKLIHLNYLDLRFNLLTGPVPPFLANLTNLTYLGLSFNHLTGPIPPPLSQLPELDTLLLDHNKLTGSIPESFSTFQQQNFYLYLGDNLLSGRIPPQLGYANFSLIDVSRNILEGDISFLFGKNKSLDLGDFSRNQFEFDLSNVEFSSLLTDLDLSHNKVYGGLPADLGRTGLFGLNVSYNRLCGRIPKLGRFQAFRETAFLHNKCLCGKPLPECK